MAETTKKKGRPKKSTKAVEEVITTVEETTETTTTNENETDIIKQLMEQVANLQKQVEQSKNEKTDLEQLVTALKSNSTQSTKNLPNKTRVVCLLENHLNLSTQPNGGGRIYAFSGFGDTKIIRLQDIEDILSIAQYREQAENGYFYICDRDIVEELGLADEYETICDADKIKMIEKMDTDLCVDLFLGLSDSMKSSIATAIAEKINKGTKVDRNNLLTIKEKTDIDIEEIAESLKEIEKSKE